MPRNLSRIINEQLLASDVEVKKRKLTAMLKANFKFVEKNLVKNLKTYIVITEQLDSLKNLYKIKRKGQFYHFVTTNFDYQKVTRFLKEFLRFQNVPMNFSDLKNKATKLEAWFECEECLQLPVSDHRSKTFWLQCQTGVVEVPSSGQSQMKLKMCPQGRKIQPHLFSTPPLQDMTIHNYHLLINRRFTLNIRGLLLKNRITLLQNQKWMSTLMLHSNHCLKVSIPSLPLRKLLRK